MERGGTARNPKRFLAGVLALVILAIAAYVFSGFHRHDPFANKACSFSQFERGASLEAAGQIDFHPPLVCRWRGPEDAAIRPRTIRGARAGGRAPPLCS